MASKKKKLYRYTIISRVLYVVRVEATSKEEAQAKGESAVFNLPPLTEHVEENAWEMGYEDDSETVELETDEDLMVSEIGYEILDKEGKL